MGDRRCAASADGLLRLPERDYQGLRIPVSPHGGHRRRRVRGRRVRPLGMPGYPLLLLLPPPVELLHGQRAVVMYKFVNYSYS